MDSQFVAFLNLRFSASLLRIKSNCRVAWRKNSAVLRVLLAVVPVVNQCDQEADQADDGQS